MNVNGQSSTHDSVLEARRWLMGGHVQGVGYRAFVFNLAQRFKLSGKVQNLTGEVLVEAQGDPAELDAFSSALVSNAPPLSRPRIIICQTIPLRELNGFAILPSVSPTTQPNSNFDSKVRQGGDESVTKTVQSARQGTSEADNSASALADSGLRTFSEVNAVSLKNRDWNNVHIPPDNYLCDDCRREMLDPNDRRYRYPFINCTQCGPRYTLITRMPYDRPNTTMADFSLCAACRTEYEDPRNRRFHAQPLACPECGPHPNFIAPHQHAEGDAALVACVAALRNGETVAVKGIGGYHLMCDALNPAAIGRLRINKHRPHKPLAVMFPLQGDDGLQRVREELQLDEVAATALTDVARPIVLIPKREDSILLDSIAPGLNDIGTMLPYSPLHHLLLENFGGPLIATSGNVSGEPVLTDNRDVEARLGKMVQAFLHHNRPIARPADDSVLRIVAGKPRLMRAGRGIAPLEFELPFTLSQPLLAVGGHMKNSIALGWNNRAVLSPHIGDLDATRSLEIFEQVIADLQQLYGVTAEALVCDAHPGYSSSRWAAKQGLPLQRVQHHHAHASTLAFEGGLEKTWLTFTWDGVGFGEDGSLWGGEALLGKPGAWQRVASFKPFRLPGGERAGRDPWRSAAALCWESGIDWCSSARDAVLLKSAWEHGLNAPTTTAVGRLFDAASSLLGLCDRASYEGQGPMLLEATAQGITEAIELPLYYKNELLIVDWTPLLHALRRDDVPVPISAMQFHLSLAHSIAMQAQRILAHTPFDAVGLTGGVFQNKLLAELALQQLSAAGFEAYLPQQAPCNDGGLALGQLIEIGSTWTP